MAETVREVPLSLQVFHSHNEYKAHRRNRTEQIYLRDLSAGLGREEKLYVKEYAFQRSSFHRHYARRFSAPLLSAPSKTPSRSATAPTSALASTPRPSASRQNLRSASSSVFASKDGSKTRRPVSQPSPRASLFSASACVQNATNNASPSTPLAARMLDGLKEMSVSTRFQRIQRKFSIASMTENGCLTAEGNSLADDIQEARKRLFKHGGQRPRKIAYTKNSTTSDQADENVQSDLTMVKEDGGDKSGEKNPETEEPILHEKALPTELSANSINQHGTKLNTNDRGKSPRENTLSNPKEAETSEIENTQNSFEMHPQMKEPLRKLHPRSGTNFPKHGNSRKQGHVTITEPIPEHADDACENTIDGDLETEDNTSQFGLLSHQTSSIFKRFLSNTPYTEPLQLKIKEFLQDQTQFNHRFPKGQEDSGDQSERHKELLSGEKEKKERLQKEHDKKKEIVFEVLTKLGITDEHIWFHYDQ